MANKAIRERNIDAYYSVRMVDTWTPIFDLSTPEKVRKYTGTTEADIDRIICSVRERRRNRYMTPHTPAIFTERIAQPFYDRRVRLTSHFHVEEGCGRCSGESSPGCSLTSGGCWGTAPGRRFWRSGSF